MCNNVNLTVYKLSTHVLICAAMFFSLSEAARKIGISRAWLYREYLPRYKPTTIADRPVLSKEQIADIRAEVRAVRQAKTKQSNGNGHK